MPAHLRDDAVPHVRPGALYTSNPRLAEDEALLGGVVAAVRAAGAQVLRRFPPAVLPADRAQVVAAIHANDAVSLKSLRPALTAVRPRAGWVEDELDTGALPPGEWWVTDTVEGNINHVHGIPDWSVTAALVREGAPVLAAVHEPLTGHTFTAVRGGGAHRDGLRLRVSAKTALDGAFVGTGQARPGEDAATLGRIAASTVAMLPRALVTRVSVPATTQLVYVASGRMDVFWQYSDVRSGLVAGALLAAEAGGVVTDVWGRPWDASSPDFLASAPGLHAAAVDVLSGVR
ncbi:3'(2'),5'-bisphosphate nucleotidase CysQ [Streptomyces sp. p1417]|uniref:3'(2'),5'-bisphosphate nucleotidase CysQ n=1 Tax=Streptomyces typhae TaxID=2681492 RepID=A0A6L6X6S6_9ACTN|nr:inositol monophosphatase family protein [Streptomyces typhae]MVO89427.1 3'(2'),5'-bisphosphate nucleotidase CysQ [Streptomyces typhae]